MSVLKGFSVVLYPEWIDFVNVCVYVQQCLELWHGGTVHLQMVLPVGLEIILFEYVFL